VVGVNPTYLFATAAAPVEFEEGGVKKSQPQIDFLKGFLTSLPKAVEYSEVANGVVPGKRTPQQLAADALKYQDEQQAAGNGTTIAQAVEHVNGLAAK